MLTRMFCFVLPSLLIAAQGHGEHGRISPDTAYEYQLYQQAYFSHWQPQTALDMLLRIPDISSQRQPNGTLQIQLHGMDRSYLAILVNGYPLVGNGENNNRALSDIPASLINAIEIIPNSVADLDAQGGAAGVINIKLKHGDTPETQVSFGVAGEPLNYSASLFNADTFSWGQLSLVADTRQQQRTLSVEDSTEPSLIEDSRTKDLISKNKSQSVHLSYESPLGQPLQLSSRLLYLHNDQQQNTSLQRPFGRRQNESTTWRLDGAATGLWQDKSNNIRWRLHLLAEQFDEDEQSLTSFTRNEQRLQLGGSLAEKIDEHHWKAGLNLFSTDTDLQSPTTDTTLNDQRLLLQTDTQQLSLHAYALDRWSVTQRLQFEAGVRMETHELEQQNPASGQNETNGNTVWLPNVHLMYRYDDEIRIGLSGSQSARHPDLLQRTPYQIRSGDVIFRGNADLDIETVSALDLRYEYQHIRQPERFTYLRLFRRTISDAILETQRAAENQLVIVEPQNSDVSAIQQGAEFSSGYRLMPGLSLRTAAGVYRSFLRSSAGNDTRRLDNQPQYRLMLALDKTINAWKGGAQWRYQGNSETQRNNFTAQDDDQSLTAETRSPGHRVDFYLSYQAVSWQVGLTASPSLASEEKQRSAAGTVRLEPQPLWRLNASLSF